MTDIRDRLKKLAGLVRHDEEALSTCEDAIKEFDRLMPAGNAGAAANAASTAYVHSWYRGTTFAAPPPPSQTTQVKLGTGQDQILPLPYKFPSYEFKTQEEADRVALILFGAIPTRGV